MSQVRRLWQLFEPVHAVVYFDPVAHEPLDGLGIKGFWVGYHVQRAAPLGPVPPELVTAAFFGFHPRRAAAVLPDAWTRVSPYEALVAREEGAVAALSGHLKDTPVVELADLLWRAAQQADCAGRVLAAANAALPRSEDPVAAIWQATTTLREHRGDGHVAALVSHAVLPRQAMLLKVAAGESVGEHLRKGRGWSEESWASAQDELVSRHFVDRSGELTDVGHALRGSVERATDVAAERPWSALSHEEVSRVEELLAPIAASVWASGLVPQVNPIGLPPTAASD